MSENMRHYVYTLAYPASMSGHVFYVGKGSGYRINTHEQEAMQGIGRNTRKENTIRKIEAHGEKTVKTKVAFFETNEEALQYEIGLIFCMKPYGHLTNLTDGGEGTSGLKRTFSEEARRKMSEARKGEKRKPRGKPSAKTRLKIGLALRGKMLAAETRIKMSEAKKQYWARKREQALPVDTKWKQGIVPLSLWPETIQSK